jgi:hypothetical protein
MFVMAIGFPLIIYQINSLLFLTESSKVIFAGADLLKIVAFAWDPRGDRIPQKGQSAMPSVLHTPTRCGLMVSEQIRY